MTILLRVKQRMELGDCCQVNFAYAVTGCISVVPALRQAKSSLKYCPVVGRIEVIEWRIRTTNSWERDHKRGT